MATHFPKWLQYFHCYQQCMLLSSFSRVWLCDPIDGSPPGSPIPGILQARTLEWVAISFSNSNAWEFQFCKSSPIIFIIYWMTAIPTDVKWYLTGALFGISLVANNVEHLLMGLLTVSKLTIEKYLLKSFAHFLIWSFIFLFSFKYSLYILDTTLLPEICLLIVLSPSLSCLFTFLMISFVTQCFNFNVIWIFCFSSIVACAFSIINT